MRTTSFLPPLHALRAFEAVARHAGVSRASQELLITQSAVSHHIRKLEHDLGAPLFARHARGMTLTPEGARYFEAASQAFALIAEGTAALRGGASDTVRVSVLPSFAAHWLAPRLSRFRAAHPTVTVELDPTLNAADFKADGLDLAVRYGDGGWPGLEVTLLMTERLTPVVGATAGPIADLPLLVTRKAFDWALWAEAAGFDYAAARKVQLTDYNVVLQSALKGEGMALGRLRLVGEQVAAGALATPFDRVVESTDAAYWLVRPLGRPMSRATHAFADWLALEAGREDAATNPRQ
jgi:LysR family glycine cleavage system transcriptional activator